MIKKVWVQPFKFGGFAVVLLDLGEFTVLPMIPPLLITEKAWYLHRYCTSLAIMHAHVHMYIYVPHR